MRGSTQHPPASEVPRDMQAAFREMLLSCQGRDISSFSKRLEMVVAIIKRSIPLGGFAPLVLAAIAPAHELRNASVDINGFERLLEGKGSQSNHFRTLGRRRRQSRHSLSLGFLQ